MKLRTVLLASLGAVLLPVAASASTVTISTGEIAKAFELHLGAGLFTAYTTNLSAGADTSLFLFSNDWKPLVFNDNSIGSYLQDTCPGDLPGDATPCGGSLSPGSFIWDVTTAGTYHLVVAETNAQPIDGAGNNLFDNDTNCSYFVDAPYGSAGSCLAAAGMANVQWGGIWSNFGGLDGNGYNASFNLSGTFNRQSIDLTSSPEALPTPEPTSMILFGTGAMGLVAKLRRRKNQK